MWVCVWAGECLWRWCPAEFRWRLCELTQLLFHLSLWFCKCKHTTELFNSKSELLILMKCKRIATHLWILTLAFQNTAQFLHTLRKKGNILSIPSLCSLLCNPNTQVNTRDSCTAMKRCVSAVDLFKGISKSVGTVTNQITYIYNSI